MARVTLSFDNGPDPVGTPLVLDALARHHIKSSFFLVGSQLCNETAIQLVKRAADEGHNIGNHSFSHHTPLGEDTRTDAVEQEIARTEHLISTFASVPKLFRPFGGGGKIGKHLLSAEAVNYLTANRYTCVLWNCVPGDWLEHDAWVDNALAECNENEWSLIVLHDIVPQAMKHLDHFISSLMDAGHQIMQEFPPACMPIREGVIVGNLSEIVAENT